MSVKTNHASTTAYENKHELEARIAGLEIALRQSQPEAIAHIECVLGALLLSMEAPATQRFMAALDTIEVLPTEQKEVVQLFGEISADGETVCGKVSKETGETIKSKRQEWREELAELKGQLADMPDEPEI